MSQSLIQNRNKGNNHNKTLQETNQQRLIRIKKSKNIRKQKVLQKRIQNIEIQNSSRQQLTRQQRKEIQKEKNRMAAQISRDKQKKYVQDLENKITDMEKLIQYQLCRKCKAALSDHSSTQDDHFQFEKNQQAPSPQNIQKIDSQIDILINQPEIQQSLFVREYSKSDFEWGNVGKYFCLFLVIISACLLSSSIQMNQQNSNFFNKPVARILTEQQPICHKQLNCSSSKQIISPSALQQIKLKSWPFKQNTGQLIEQCKNNFWEQYLKNIQKQVTPYSNWNLVSCNNPNLIHVSNISQGGQQPQQEKWTFLIANPTVSHTHIQRTGNHYIDEVSYLDGLYQMVAQKVVLKKVIGKKCIA